MKIRVNIKNSILEQTKKRIKKVKSKMKKSLSDLGEEVKNDASSILKISQTANRGLNNVNEEHLFEIIKREKTILRKTKNGFALEVGNELYLDNETSSSSKSGFPYWRAVEFGIKGRIPKPVVWKSGGKIVPSGNLKPGDFPIGFAKRKAIYGSRFKVHKPYQLAGKNAKKAKIARLSLKHIEIYEEMLIKAGIKNGRKAPILLPEYRGKKILSRALDFY